MRVALGMDEIEFIRIVEEAVKPADVSAKIIPLSGQTHTKATVVETFTIGIVSPVEKRQAVYAALVALVKPWRELVTYSGWSLNIDRSSGAASDFSMVVHTITAKLHAKGCE